MFLVGFSCEVKAPGMTSLRCPRESMISERPSKDKTSAQWKSNANPGKSSSQVFLQSLDLTRTNVTDAGVKKLKAALPKCDIGHCNSESSSALSAVATETASKR